jgi:ribosome-associated toxin RatA of RatAB toxin-antitoxin module
VSEGVKEDIIVEASPDDVMDFIADFEAYPKWNDEIKEAEILETDDDGWGTKVRYVVDAKLLSTSYVLGYTYHDTPGESGGDGYRMEWHLVEGDQVRKVDGVYVLVDQGDGTTKVTYDLEVEPSFSVPKVMRRKAAQRIVHNALEGVKKHVEGG